MSTRSSDCNIELNPVGSSASGSGSVIGGHRPMSGYGVGSGGGKEGSVSPRDNNSDDVSDMKELKKMFYKLYIEEKLEKKRKKQASLKNTCKSICSIEYLKEIFPSVILIIVAIIALTASAKAQHDIQKVNSDVASANALALNTRKELGETQQLMNGQLAEAQATLTQLKGEILLLTQRTNETIAMARAQAIEAASFAVNEVINGASKNITELNTNTQQLSNAFLRQLQELESNYTAVVNKGKNDLKTIGMDAESLTTQANTTSEQAKIAYNEAMNYREQTKQSLDAHYNQSLNVYQQISTINTTVLNRMSVVTSDINRVSSSAIQSMLSKYNEFRSAYNSLSSAIPSSLPSSCYSALLLGYNTTGIYTISPDSSSVFNVYCDQVTDGGGWTLVWSNTQLGYDKPFTSIPWTHALNTVPKTKGKLSTNLEDFMVYTGLRWFIPLSSNKKEMRYDWSPGFTKPIAQSGLFNFNIDTTRAKYELSVSNYRQLIGTIQAGILAHNGYSFSTYDVDRTSGKCASQTNGAPFWYGDCFSGSIWGFGAVPATGNTNINNNPYSNAAYWVNGVPQSTGDANAETGQGGGNGWIYIR